MKMKVIISALLFLSLAGCSKTVMQDRDRTIRLALSLDGVEADTRTTEAEPYVNTAPTVEHPFKTDVWFTLTPGEYGHNPLDGEEVAFPVHTMIEHKDALGTEAMFEDKNVLYPLDENESTVEEAPVYCLGFYPANEDDGSSEGWKQDGTVVTHKITGTQDLMFADLIKGNYNENFPPQEFNHLLTWVKINVIANSVDAAGAWGKVKYLSIGGKRSTVRIDLTTEYGTPSVISYVRDEALDTLCLKTVDAQNDVSKMVDLSIGGTLAGSVFCCPPEAKSESDPRVVGYWVTVQTSNVPEKKDVFVPITWNDQYDTDGAGKLLIINLYFNEIEVVSGVCSLSYWENTSEDLYLEQEQATNQV